MDKTDFIRINRQLEKLEANDDTFRHLINEQLSYAPKIELVMKNQVAFAQTISDITKMIDTHAKDLWKNDKFNTGIRMITNLIGKMKHTSKTLTNAMLTTNNGKIDPNLIPPK